MSVKQYLVVRRDLEMPLGKLAAQLAHAGGLWLQRRLRLYDVSREQDTPPKEYVVTADLSEAEYEWATGMEYTKVVVEVPDEAALHALKVKASRAGLNTHVVRDLGRTVFKGVETVTCLAVGPDTAEKLDPLFRHLPLYGRALKVEPDCCSYYFHGSCKDAFDTGCWYHFCTKHCRTQHVTSEHSCCPKTI